MRLCESLTSTSTKNGRPLAHERACFYPIDFFSTKPVGIKADRTTCPHCGAEQPMTARGEIPAETVYPLPPPAER